MVARLKLKGIDGRAPPGVNYSAPDSAIALVLVRTVIMIIVYVQHKVVSIAGRSRHSYSYQAESFTGLRGHGLTAAGYGHNGDSSRSARSSAGQ